MLRKLALIGARYGAIAAFLSVSLMVVMYYLGRHPLLLSPYFDFRIALYGILIFFSLKEYRDFHQGGELHFFQGMLGSFVFVAMAGVVGSMLLWIFGVLEKDFLQTFIAAYTEYLKGFPEEKIALIGKEAYERNLAALPSTNMAQIAVQYLVQSFAIGLFVSIILSVILRKQPKPD